MSDLTKAEIAEAWKLQLAYIEAGNQALKSDGPDWLKAAASCHYACIGEDLRKAKEQGDAMKVREALYADWPLPNKPCDLAEYVS